MTLGSWPSICINCSVLVKETKGNTVSKDQQRQSMCYKLDFTFRMTGKVIKSHRNGSSNPKNPILDAETVQIARRKAEK